MFDVDVNQQHRLLIRKISEVCDFSLMGPGQNSQKLVLMELDGLLDDTHSAAKISTADRCNSTDADQCSFPKKENYDEFLNSSEGIIKKTASSIRVKATTKTDIGKKPLAGSQTNVKLMATRILTRFGRNVKRVQRYGVALELRQPWERKKVADVRIVKEKQQEKSREKICARDSEFKFASMKMTKASASAGVKVNVKRAPGGQDYVIEREMVNKKVDSKIFKNFQEDSNVKSHEVSAVREEANLHTSREMSAAEDVVAENIAEERDSTIVQEAVRPALRAVRNSKQRQREIKRATRDAERRVKLEEIQKKREARKLKKEMKEKLLRAKRERREAERKKLEEEQLELKRKKRAITTGLLYVQDIYNPFAGLPEEAYFLELLCGTTFFLLNSFYLIVDEKVCANSERLKSIMRVADCAEVLFYIMVDMLGLLTWRGLDNHQTTKHKERFVEQNRKQLPIPLVLLLLS
ncbi:hypothetical protein NECAME_11905 [Necator americanus]|uniref:Uncharacterized protein n=1 Tax=Necator americanus TaxID=51031 RepID=W2T2H2_NECAM|nr:hypothetical protein NECAME_11905 [Necator americanus]ETN76103.1 hypothetical protein NECAME_11905 [Necator americanus]